MIVDWSLELGSKQRSKGVVVIGLKNRRFEETYLLCHHLVVGFRD